MMRMRHCVRISVSFLFFALVACGGGEPEPFHPVPAELSKRSPAAIPSAVPGAQPAETVTTMTVDSPMTTPFGASYTAPKGWTVTTQGVVVILQDPDREVSVTFVERKEPAGEGAIAAAWKQVKPGFERNIKQTSAPPGRGGWDAVAVVEYNTTTEEARGVWAHARRKGDTWYVALFDGASPAWERRWAGAQIAFDSFKVQGVEEESFRGKTAHTMDAARLQQLEAFVEDARKAAKIPGIAMAVVQGGKVVFEKGFGVRELGKKDAVTPATLFRIASMTKPLTSLMMAELVDEGKFSWDTPVTQLAPGFSLGDPELTKRITMKNILCACTGIPYDNLGTDFEYAAVSAEMMLERMKSLKPTSGFGETFQYSNAMVSVAGYIAAHVLDPRKPMEPAYDKAMQTKVLGPLGMKATTFDGTAAKRADHAEPHSRTPKLETVPIPFAWGGAGRPRKPGAGAWSNVVDLARYLLLELGKGKTPEGKQVVSAANLLVRRELQVRSGDKEGYGLALDVEDYKGVRIHGHGGGALGYSSAMFFLPEHGVGAVILANIGPPDPLVYRDFRRKLFELLFDGRDEARGDLAFTLKTQEKEALDETAKIDLEPDRGWLERFVGTYDHPLYGKVTLRLEGNGGIFDAGEWQSAIGRKKERDGTVKIALTTPPWRWVELVPKETNGTLTLTFQDGQRKVVFEPVKQK